MIILTLIVKQKHTNSLVNCSLFCAEFNSCSTIFFGCFGKRLISPSKSYRHDFILFARVCICVVICISISLLLEDLFLLIVCELLIGSTFFEYKEDACSGSSNSDFRMLLTEYVFLRRFCSSFIESNWSIVFLECRAQKRRSQVF